MSIEKLIQENTAALLALTEHLKSSYQGGAAQNSTAPAKAEVKVEEKKPAATAPAATQATAEAPAAQEPKASNSVPAEVSEEQAAEYLKKVVAAKGRDTAVGLLTELGVKRLSELDAAGRVSFVAAAQKVIG